MLQTDLVPPDPEALQEAIADAVGADRVLRRLDPDRPGRVRQPPAGQRHPVGRRLPARRSAAVGGRRRPGHGPSGAHRRRQPRGVRVGPVGGARPGRGGRPPGGGGSGGPAEQGHHGSFGRGAGHGAGVGGSAPGPGRAARPAHPPGRPGHRLPEQGSGRALPRPRRAGHLRRRRRPRLGAHPGRGRVLVPVAHLQGRVRGGPAAPRGGLRPRPPATWASTARTR